MTRSKLKMDLQQRLLYQLIGLALSLGLVLLAFEHDWSEKQSVVCRLGGEGASYKDEYVENQILPPISEENIVPVVPFSPPNQTLEEQGLKADLVNNCSTDSKYEEHIFITPEINTEPPDEFLAYLKNNIKWPEQRPINATCEKIFLQFTVDKSGSLQNIQVIKGINPAYDQEVLRVFKNSPKWSPGMQHGTPIEQRMTYPIRVHFKPEKHQVTKPK